jgi:hypothetical protein
MVHNVKRHVFWFAFTWLFTYMYINCVILIDTFITNNYCKHPTLQVIVRAGGGQGGEEDRVINRCRNLIQTTKHTVIVSWADDKDMLQPHLRLLC